jgi:hypothetical protein
MDPFLKRSSETQLKMHGIIAGRCPQGLGKLRNNIPLIGNAWDSSQRDWHELGWIDRPELSKT